MSVTKPEVNEVLFEIKDGTEYATLHADAFRTAMRERDEAIERCERLQALVEHYKNALGISAGGHVDWIVRADQAQAENKRLRTELRTCQETLTACLETQ